MAAITDVCAWMPSRTTTDVMLDAEYTLACHLTAPLWPTPLTHAAGFQNVRADPSITNPSTTTWLDPPHPHPTHSMWSLLVLTTPSTALTRSNQAPTIHSLHQEVTVLVYTRASNIGKESHGKMAATMYAPVLMPRWANTNVYPNALFIHPPSPHTVERSPYLDNAVPNSAVIFLEPMALMFHHQKYRSHLPLPCPMEVSSPLHLSVVSQDRLSTPCQPTPRQPPSQHSLDRDSPSLRARSPWSEISVSSHQRMVTSSLSTMKESNGTMAATTHVPARTDLPDIMNAFHHAQPTITWSLAVATWSVWMENVALSPDVPSLMARLWIPQRSRLHSPSYLPSAEDTSISDPTQTTPPWDREDTLTCLEAEMSVSTRDVSTSRVSHGVTVATLTVDVTTHPLDSSLAHLDVQSTPNCHLSVLWTLFLVTVARN